MSNASLSDPFAQLAGELAHHVNNPLAALEANLSVLERLCSELTADRPAPGAEAKELIDDIRLGLRDIGQVVRRMTELSYALEREKHLLGSPFKS